MFRTTITVFSLFLALLYIGISSCNRKKVDPVMQRIDSLEQQLGAVANNLNVDKKTIQSRYEEMEANMKTIQFEYHEEFSEEMAQKMTRYRAIAKIYMKYLKREEQLNKRMDDQYIRLKAMRNSIEDKKITQEAFKEYYSLEQKETKDLLNESQKFAQILYEVETEYQRLSTYVEEIIQRLPKQ